MTSSQNVKSPVYAGYADEYDSPVKILRGTVRIVTAVTGLLLAYGITFALEGMTTRVPTSAVRELATVSLFTAPWLLLFCSGLQDFVIVTRKQWVLWLGVFAITLFLYYFDRYTSLSILTKIAMPPVAVGLGLIPYFVKKMGFVFALSSLAAGVAGVTAVYYFAAPMLLPTTHFATRTIGALVVTFCLAGITSGALAIFDIYRRLTRPSYV
jgi:hypothetical protein